MFPSPRLNTHNGWLVVALQYLSGCQSFRRRPEWRNVQRNTVALPTAICFQQDSVDTLHYARVGSTNPQHPAPSTQHPEPPMPPIEPKKGILFGLASGFVAITCCVSPVAFVLLGIATAAEAVTLGDTLYYEYGWYFRTAGLIVAVIAVVLFLRGRNQCNIRGAYTYRWMLVILVASGAATYAGLFWFTKYLGIWFG